MNSAVRTVAKFVAPAVQRASSTAASSTKTQAKAGFKVVEILYGVPPLLAIFGYGGTVCFHETGALRRIRRSFAEVPH